MFRDSFDIFMPKVSQDFYLCPDNMSEIGRQMIYESSKDEFTKNSLMTSSLQFLTPLVLQYCTLTNKNSSIQEHKDWEVDFRSNRLFMMYEDFMNDLSNNPSMKKEILVPCQNSAKVQWLDVEKNFRNKVSKHLGELTSLDGFIIETPELSSGKTFSEKSAGHIIVKNRFLKEHTLGPLYSKFEFLTA